MTNSIQNTISGDRFPAPFNISQNKLYEGVSGNLVTHACKVSFQQGFDGFVAFTAKTKLIEHYENTLGAYTLSGPRMIIPTQSAQILVDKYLLWDIYKGTKGD